MLSMGVVRSYSWVPDLSSKCLVAFKTSVLQEFCSIVKNIVKIKIPLLPMKKGFKGFFFFLSQTLIHLQCLEAGFKTRYQKVRTRAHFLSQRSSFASMNDVE